MRTDSEKQIFGHLLFFLLVALFAGQPVLFSQNSIVFEAQGPAKDIAEGARFEVSFTLKNTVAQRFIAPDFKGFRITAGPSELRSAGFANGKSYNHQSWTYELEAGAPGVYTIGTAITQTSSQTLRTQPLVIRVVKAKTTRPKTPARGSDERLFLSGELDRETAWVGQQVLYQIKVYTQVGISDYDILELPPLEGFFSQERRRFDTRVQYQTIRGKKYAVRILYEMALFPQQSGSLVIGPARVRVGVEPSGGGLRALLGSAPMLLQTPPVTLTVNPLPAPVPDNFSGGVGAYTWSVSADKNSLTTDDALTLTVSIEGNGDPRRFSSPRFELPDGLEGFDPKPREQEEYETGEQFVHTSVLEYVILPKQPGEYAISPELVIFNTDSNGYQTLRMEQPVRFAVTPGPTYGQNAEPLDTVAAPSVPRSVWENIWSQAANRLTSFPLWGLLGGILVSLALLVWWQKKKDRPEVVSEPEMLLDTKRPKPDVKNLRGRLQEIRRLIQPNGAKLFYHELLKTIQAYIAAHLHLEPALLSQHLMEEKLAARHVPQPVIDALVTVWQTCEKSVFAGQTFEQEMSQTWENATQALKQLDAALR